MFSFKNNYKQYSKRKPSQQEWIMDIPESWSTKRIRFVADVNPTGTKIDLDNSDEVSFIPMECVNEYGGLILDGVKALDEIGSGYTLFIEDDVVVAKITPCFENGKGSIAKGLKNRIAFGTTELHVIRAGQDLNVSFLFYLTMSDVFRKTGESFMYGAGGQKRISDKFIKNFQIPLPVLKEQQAIANFLDQKTKQIDDLIEHKEKLLELLTEKRTAIITQAVTKGLNPKVKMKDSGIEWLGEVPEHWDLKRLRFLVETNPLKSKIELSDDELVSFIPMEAVGEYGGLNVEEEKEVNEVYNGYTYFQNNDVVVAKITPCFENGKGALADGLKNGVAFGTTELHVLRSTVKMDSKYLFYLSISDFFRKIGESWMYGAGGQKRVPEEFLKDLFIPCPDVSEQTEIGNWLEKKISELKLASDRIEDSINKLTEYRSSLITSAVTGQIDVRNEAIA